MQKKVDIVGSLALKAGILYIIAELITRGISFLITPVFTRLLPSEVYANVKIYESWVYLIAPILSLSLYQSIPRAKFDFESRYRKYVSSTLFFMLIITIAVGIVLTPLISKISNLLGFSIPLVYFMLIYCYAYNSIQCIQAYDRQMMYYKENMILTFLSIVPAVIISVIFVIISNNRVTNSVLLNIRIYSFFIPTTIIGIVVAVFWIVKEKEFFNYTYWKYGIIYSAPVIIFSLSTQVLFQSDKIMVKAICGIRETAIVALAATVGYIMDILAHAIDNAWRPWLFEKLNSGDYENIKNVWKQLLFLMAVMTWAMVILAPELIAFLGGEQYKEAVWLIAPIMCGSFANFIGIAYTALEQFYKKTKCMSYASAITAILNIGLNFIFIKYYGYIASAYTTAISYVVAAIIHYYFIQKFDKTDVLNSKQNFVVWVLAFIICIFSMVFYRLNIIIRFLVLICVIGGIFLKKRKMISTIYYNIKKR